MDYTNQYTYLNNNITTLTKGDGSTQSFSYSNIINNFSVLQENSYGKKIRGIFNAECFASTLPSFQGISKNLDIQEASTATYITLPNNYYSSRTQITNGTTPNANNAPYQSTENTEFFFN